MRVTHLTRLLSDPEIGAEKIAGHWCVPRFNGMMHAVEEFEKNSQGIKRKRAVEDHDDIEKSKAEFEEEKERELKRLKVEQNELGLALQDDVSVLDSRVCFPQAGYSRAMSLLSLQFVRDLRRRAMQLEEDED